MYLFSILRFFFSSTLRLCVFFFSSLVAIGSVSPSSSLLFCSGSRISRPFARFHVKFQASTATHKCTTFSMHLYRFGELQCARPHSPEFRAFLFIPFNSLYGTTHASLHQVPRTKEENSKITPADFSSGCYMLRVFDGTSSLARIIRHSAHMGMI